MSGSEANSDRDEKLAGKCEPNGIPSGDFLENSWLFSS
jgi:hypothetical protein